MRAYHYLFFLIILLLTACSTNRIPQSQIATEPAIKGGVPPIDTPTPLPVATAVMVTETAVKTAPPPSTSARPAPPWPAKTYHNDAIGFSLDYPKSWFINLNGTQQGTLMLFSFDPSASAGMGGIPAGSTKMDIILDIPPVGITDYQKALEYWRQQATSEGASISGEQAFNLPGGVLLTRWQIKGQADTVLFSLVSVNGHLIEINVYGDLAPGEQVMQTIRGD